MNPISNSDDVIDSRDVIARIDELEDMRGQYLDQSSGGESPDSIASWDDCEEGRELAALKASLAY